MPASRSAMPATHGPARLREQETKLPTPGGGLSELDDFLATTLARQVEAEEALHNGDPEPRLAMWSTQDPVTVLGAVRSARGWDEVSRLFRWVGSGFSDCTSYRFELVAAGVSGTWPTPSATSTPRCPGTALHSTRTPWRHPRLPP